MKLASALAFVVTSTLAQAQVYVPGPGYPLCFPIVQPGGTTVMVCQ
jgi:hypothetical protein